MTNLSKFDVNGPANPENTIFGLPFNEEDAAVVLVSVPWEVTVSCGTGTSRSPEYICKASTHVDIFDSDAPEAWKKGFYMRSSDKKLLMKSDYLRKEAELYIDFISREQDVKENKFMTKSLREINEGSELLNNYVYNETKKLLDNKKLVGLIGGDHSVGLGYYKALSEKYNEFGILQIDAHCDLRRNYLNFTNSHASIMYNALEQFPNIKKLVQIGVRDYCEEEWRYICNSNFRVVAYFDEQIKERMFDGETWKSISHEIIQHLPQNIYISFDIDGLDPKLCPHTGTPVFGGFQAEQIVYLFKKIAESGRTIIGFDLVEVGGGDMNNDANVAARMLWKMCNLLIKSNSH